MNLLNRYLQAVGRLLPKARRDDIIAELRANILSQMDDRQEELGRPLTEDEQAAILQHHGNPSVIAGRYRENNLGLAFGRQLIGPELFPFYKVILTVNVVITAVVFAAVLPVVMHIAGGALTVGRVLMPLVTQFIVITLIFMIVEQNKSSVLDKWDPRKLPAMKANLQDGPTAANIFNFIVTAIATLWLALAPRWLYLLLGPGALYLVQLGLSAMPSLPAFYVSIVAVFCARLTLQFFTIFRWLERPKVRIMDVILRCVSLAIGVLLMLKAPNFVTAPNPDVAHWANLNFEIAVAIWTAINLWGTARAVYSLFQQRNQMLPARQY
jgi:hypothetical protein